MRPSILVFAALAVGCSQPDPKGTTSSNPTTPTGGTPTGTTPTGGTTSTSTYDPLCGDRVASVWPEADRVNVFYRTSIEWRLDPDPFGDEVLIVKNPAGEVVPGSMNYWLDVAEFVPDAPLAPSTAYTVELQGCPPSQITWSTSQTGAAIDPALAVGTTFAVDLDSGRWIEPPGVGSLLSGYLTVDILVGVQAADATTLDVMGAVSEEGTSVQDMCAETIAFPIADFSENPYFELGPSDIAVSVLGASIEMSDLHLSGAFRPDFGGLEGARLDGTLDTRGLVEILDPGGTPDSVCILLGAFGVICGPCPSGGNYCVDALVDDLAVPAVQGPLVSRTAYDIAADVTCP